MVFYNTSGSLFFFFLSLALSTQQQDINCDWRVINNLYENKS